MGTSLDTKVCATARPVENRGIRAAGFARDAVAGLAVARPRQGRRTQLDDYNPRLRLRDMTTNAPHRARILIADDQADVVTALKLLLSDEGYDVTAAASPAAVLAAVEKADFDLALLDLNYTRDTTSGQEGLDLIDRLQAVDPTLPVLVMTAWSSVAGAVEAMRHGARDYIEKPWADERLLATLRMQIDLRRALSRTQRLEEASAR